MTRTARAHFVHDARSTIVPAAFGGKLDDFSRENFVPERAGAEIEVVQVRVNVLFLLATTPIHRRVKTFEATDY